MAAGFTATIERGLSTIVPNLVSRFEVACGYRKPVTLCDLGIFTDQAAEPVPAPNPDVGARSGRMRTPGRRALLQRPVRAMQVVMVGVLV